MKRLKKLIRLISMVSVIIPVLISSVSAENGQTKDWSIIATYTIPGKASGLASDGTFIYFGIYGLNGSQVHKFNPVTGTSEILFTSPDLGDSYGMTWDGFTIWVTDHVTSTSVPAYAMQFDLSGNLLSQFNLPDHYMSGIAYDNGDFWAATYSPDPGKIYKLTSAGFIISQFTAPAAQPWDLCIEGIYLWVADYNANMLFKVDQAGTIIESHPCENTKPAGVVFDGQYLWYVDGPLSSNSTLYKVDLSGTGTPQIDVPETVYDYGTVTLGDSAVWNCNVSSTGTSDLVVTNLIIPNAAPIFVWMTFPQVIPSGGTIQIPFIYKPSEAIPLSSPIIIESNDPVNPQVQLTVTGEGVYNGPHIQVPYTFHNYGEVRINATTRWYLEVMNDGNQSLEVTNIEFDDTRFYADDNITFPVQVAVLETVRLGVWFQPDQAGNFNGIATIFHNDQTQVEIQVSLQGSASDIDYPMGAVLWNYTINTSFDNSVKAIASIADVSGDGIADVIVGSEDDYIRCFNGNSSGWADMLWENEVGSVYGQNGLYIIEDINNDGYEDVVTGLAWGVRAVYVLSGKTGEILWIYDTHIYGSGGWVYQVWAGNDYNGDGKKDVLAATGNDGNNTGPKRIFCLNGLNGAVIWDAYTDGPNFSVIGVSDFTGDDIPDAIAGASNVNETEGKVYGINGATGAITFMHSTTGTSVWALEQLDDINNDGKKDIIAGDFSGHYYLINPASGSPLYTGIVGSSLLLRFERMSDLNGDGYADITIGHSGTNAVAVSGWNGQNLWLSGLADKCWNIDRIEDITGDGINDLIAGTLYSSNYCYFLDGVNGNVLYSVNYGEAVDGIGAVPDITGDGSWEMVAGGRNGKLTCYSGGLNTAAINADFMADVTFGYVPFSVSFTDLTSGPVNSWQWDFENDGIIDSYAQNPTHIYTGIGIYSVMLVASNASQSDTIVKVGYIIADSTVNVPEEFGKNLIQIVPNPFMDKVYIKIVLEMEEFLSLDIFDMNGNFISSLIKGQHFNAGEHMFVWNGYNDNKELVKRGVYILRLAKGKEIIHAKLIRQ